MHPDAPGNAVRARSPLARPLALLLLGLAAYHELLGFRPPRTLRSGIEEWFFVPAESLPGVVLVMVAWLVYRRWPRLTRLPSRSGPLWLTLGLLLPGLGLFAWATYTGAADLLAISLLFCGLGFASLYGGWGAVRALRLPALFLLFAVPVPAPLLNAIIFSFQIWTADLVGWLLQLLGTPVYVTGEVILRSEDRFAIIEECSGLRSVQTLTMLSLLMVDLFRRQGIHAWILVVTAPVVAFSLNGLRAITLMMNPHSEILAIHVLQGVAILLGGLVLLYVLDGLLERWLSEVDAEPPEPIPSSAVSPGKGGGRRRFAAGLLGVMAVGSLVVPRWESPEPPQLDLTYQFRRGMGDWEATPLEMDKRFLGSVSFRERFIHRYVNGPDRVELFVGLGNRSARFGSPISEKTALPGSGWITDAAGSLEFEQGLPVSWRAVRSGTRRLLVYHWYEASQGFANETLRSLLALDHSWLRPPGDVFAIRISTDLVGSDSGARARADEVLRRFYGVLRHKLNRVKRQQGIPVAGRGVRPSGAIDGSKGLNFHGLLRLFHARRHLLIEALIRPEQAPLERRKIFSGFC